ncbi:C45 family peptidase [Bacteroides sp. 51]|uniref:C45 family autoproteolytic acyltransferase/hydolase n=1 Tax=Bacteroides sp. 51 TaxID=2302938 RepID=UPI0013D39CE1|nr:C45 family peptidase [Bacteroides sp. 51]NDV81075.1 choloylglycine hydrolase [Bacteroides sp. 51]
MMIKRLLKYTGIALLAIILILTTWVWYLYSTADMLAPCPEAGLPSFHAGSEAVHPSFHAEYRQYGPNALRQSESGLWELYVEGDAFQRGEAIGHLSEDLLYFQEKVFVDQIREIIPSDSYLKFLRFFIILFNRNLGENIPEEYRQEIYAISQSCTHEYDMIGTPYERQLNYHAAHDLGHAMQDYMLVGCSSFASWGMHSEDSSLVIGRNFDFYMGDDFARNKQVAFYRPSTGHNFVTIGWVGMTGVLSGMNEHGLTVTINAAKSTMPTSSATPISVLTREILQYAQTIDEAYEIAKKRKTFVAESILIGSAKDGKAAIIEKSPDNIALFTQDEQQQLICTNHYQSEAFAHEKNNRENIETSDSPYRFERLEELLAQEGKMNEQKAAHVLRNYKGRDDADLGLANEMAINQFIAHHSVIFKPEQRLIWVSTSPWQSGKYVAYDLNKIFNDSLDFSRELYLEELTIPADSFLQQPEYQKLLTYRQLTPFIRKKGAKKEAVSEDTLQLYQASNPMFFYTHEILGDYYLSIGETEKAKAAWETAFTLPIPKKGEKERIQKKINKK